MTVTPADILWRSAACPIPTPPSERGLCAVHGDSTEVWPLFDAVTNNWPDLDRLTDAHDPARPMVCAPAWHAIRRWGPLRTVGSEWRDGHLVGVRVHQDSQVVRLRMGQVPADLTGGDPTAALIVPVTKQQGVAVWATWGAITTDRATIPFTARLLDGWHHYRLLRQAGVGERQLADTVPHHTLPAKTGLPLTELLSRWEALAPTRERPELGDVFARLNRQPKETRP